MAATRSPRLGSLADARRVLRVKDRPAWLPALEREKALTEGINLDREWYLVRAWPLTLRSDPTVEAEFAAYVFSPDDSTEIIRLGRLDRWIAYGVIRRNSRGFLVLGELNLGPLTDQDGQDGLSYRVLAG